MTDEKTQTAKQERGEGDREADRRYREDAEQFVDEGKVDEAAEQARNMSDEEARESVTAEEIGKSRARDEDPEIAHKTK